MKWNVIKCLKIILPLFTICLFITYCSDSDTLNTNNEASTLNNLFRLDSVLNSKNWSVVNKADYNSMNSDAKIEFKNLYLENISRGLIPKLSAKSGNPPQVQSSCSAGDCCSVTCPSGTKAKCQRSGQWQCDCGCEPFEAMVIAYLLNNLDYLEPLGTDGMILVNIDNFNHDLLNNSGTIGNFINSDLPYKSSILREINNLLKEINPNRDSTIVISRDKFEDESKRIKSYTDLYTAENFFTIEYEL